jgi:hypothetical protein
VADLIPLATPLIGAIIGGCIALIGVRLNIGAQFALQERGRAAQAARELAGEIIKVQEAISHFRTERSSTARQGTVAAIQEFLPAGRVVFLTLGPSSVRQSIGALLESLQSYRSRLARLDDTTWADLEQSSVETAERSLALISSVFQVQAEGLTPR